MLIKYGLFDICQRMAAGQSLKGTKTERHDLIVLSGPLNSKPAT